MMQFHESIEIRTSRLSGAIGAVPFAILTMVFFDALFIGSLNIGDLGKGVVEVTLLGMFGFGTLWCLKTALAPSLMLMCDHDGVRFGRGMFVNRSVFVPWSQVHKIYAADMTRFTTGKQRVSEAHIPAVCFQVDDSVDLGNTGFALAYPENAHNFRIAAKTFPQPFPEAVTILNEMKANSKSACTNPQ